MSEKQVKTMKNPELLVKFEVGQIVNIPRRVAYVHTTKLQVLPRPMLGRVLSQGPRQVGKHYRFAVDIRCVLGVIEFWDEWQLEAIHAATADQVQRCRQYPYLLGEPEPESSSVRGEHNPVVAEARS